MKKRNKIALAITILIIVLILLSIFIVMMPIKHVEIQINTTNGPKQELIKGQETQIYVDNYPESPGWTIYGKDGVIFNDNNSRDHIFVVGDFPKKLNYDLIGNRFVLNGKYIGEKKRKGVIAKCFYVNNWGILGQLEREGQHCDAFSKSSLTVMDEMFADPILVYDLGEFEYTDDSKN